MRPLYVVLLACVSFVALSRAQPTVMPLTSCMGRPASDAAVILALVDPPTPNFTPGFGGCVVSFAGISMQVVVDELWNVDNTACSVILSYFVGDSGSGYLSTPLGQLVPTAPHAIGPGGPYLLAWNPSIPVLAPSCVFETYYFQFQMYDQHGTLISCTQSQQVNGNGIPTVIQPIPRVFNGTAPVGCT